jgi:hypothetical protein
VEACRVRKNGIGDQMASQPTVKINWRDFPPPSMTEEQLKQFEDFVLKSINPVFEQDFENWSESYHEAVQGKS